MSGRLRVAVGFGVSLLIVAFLLWEIDVGRVVAVLGRSRAQLLPLILLPFAVDLSLRTVRWHVLLAREPRPAYRGTFAYLVIGYLANNILPMRLGELVRAHLLGTREGVGRSRALGSIAMERTLDVIAAAALGAVAGAASGIHGAIVVTLAFIALAASGLVAVIALLPHELVRRAIDGLVVRAPAGLLARIADIAGRFLHALLDAAAPGRVLAALVLSVAAWLATSGLFAVTAASLGISLSPAGLVAVAVAANLGAALPSAPAGIGPFEFGVVVIATALGVDAPTALAFGILSHVCTVVPVSLAGGLELSRMQWGLDTLQAAGRGDATVGEVEAGVSLHLGGGGPNQAVGGRSTGRDVNAVDLPAADMRLLVAIGVPALLVVLTTVIDAVVVPTSTPTTPAFRRPSGMGLAWRDWRRATSLVLGEPPHTTLRVTTGTSQSGASGCGEGASAAQSRPRVA